MPTTRRLDEEAQNVLVTAMATVIGNQFFAGRDPGVIGACLAELMSILLLNHRIPDDLAKQEQLREHILTVWCNTVRQLVAAEEAPIIERMQ